MRFLLSCFALLGFTSHAFADAIESGNILGAYAFSSGNIASGTSLSLNLWNDATGNRLTSDNGDLSDLTISYSQTTTGPTAADVSGGFEYDSSNTRLRASHAYGNVARPGNNPGSRITHTIDFVFASHLSVTDLEVDFTSLNTAGITWEFSKLGYLVAGNPVNNAEPTVAAYDSHTEVSGKAAGVGWFLADSKTTAVNVGEDLVTAGANGSLENLTNTGNNSLLDYADVGLASGTQITGFRWVSVLEDVRGSLNPSSGLTASMTRFSPSGSISAVPEPTTAIVVFCGLTAFLARRRRSQA